MKIKGPVLKDLTFTEWWMLQEMMKDENIEVMQDSGFNEHYKYIVKTPGGDYYQIDEFSEVITCVTKLKEGEENYA